MNELLRKYDVPVPRYTSYPTVPFWNNSPTPTTWIDELTKAASNTASRWSLYLHIPFCESLCTFCGCNTSITKDHSKEELYIKHVLKEWDLYKNAVPQLLQRPLMQLHLGGGTPTFLSAKNLHSLLEPILNDVKIDGQHFEGSIEVDPRRTNVEQLATLRELGFSRISMGVQDFDPEVQRLVNRIQPLEETKRLTIAARELGYTSVNYDLIYGLAKQTITSIKASVLATIALRPDRIALYSFALVPWIKPAQRLFKDEDLPKAPEKRALYELARAELLAAGYVEIGMDHFALPNDSLSKSQQAGTLHRNFMGYADLRTDIMLGLGVSAISESPGCFHQNEKVLPIYERLLNENKIPSLRGHLLSQEDRQQREKILRFMTKGATPLDAAEVQDAKSFLAEMINDQLVEIQNNTLRITTKGRPFLRNACVFFDAQLRRKQPTTQTFSSSI